MKEKSFEEENFILVDNEGYKITNGKGKNFDFKEIQDEDLENIKSLKFTVAQIEKDNIKETLVTWNEEDKTYYKVLMIEGKIAIHKQKLYLNENYPAAQGEVNIQCKCVSANLLDGMFLEKIQNTNLINKEKYLFSKGLEYKFEILSEKELKHFQNSHKNRKQYLHFGKNFLVNENNEFLIYSMSSGGITLYVKYQNGKFSLAGVKDTLNTNYEKVIVKIGDPKATCDPTTTTIEIENNEYLGDPCCNCGCCDKCSENEN